MVCKDEKCNLKHQGHSLQRYSEYKEHLSALERHIRVRDELAQQMESYKQNILLHITKVFDEIKANLFHKINIKYCSSRFL